MYMSTTVVEALAIYHSELHTNVSPPLSSVEKQLLDILDSASALLFWLSHVVPALLACALLQDRVSCNVHIAKGVRTCKACHHLAVCSFNILSLSSSLMSLGECAVVQISLKDGVRAFEKARDLEVGYWVNQRDPNGRVTLGEKCAWVVHYMA